MIATVIALLGCVSVLPGTTQHPLDGDWMGGIDSGKRWEAVSVHLQTDADGLTGTVDLLDQGRNGLPLTRVLVESSRVQLEWQGDAGPATCEGQLGDGAMTGSFQQGGTRATFLLAHVAKVEPRIYEWYVGSYRLGPDRSSTSAPTIS